MKRILLVIFIAILVGCSGDREVTTGDASVIPPSEEENEPEKDTIPYLHAYGKEIRNQNGEAVILRGIGIGGWMLQKPYMLQAYSMTNQSDIRNHIEELIGEDKTEEFYELYLENGIQKSDIDQLKEWGFNSVRIPLHYNLFTLSVEDEPEEGMNTWLDKGFELLDRVIEWCEEDEIYAILDLHAAPGGQGNDLPIADRDPSKPLLWQSAANKDKTVALWRELAIRYSDKEWVGGYDLLNETNVDFNDLDNKDAHMGGDNAPLWDLLKRITQEIRTVDKNHIIYIEGNGWANNYNGFPGPWDDNMVISFHKYQYEGDQGNTEAEIQGILDMRDEYKIPLWLGESGENNDNWYREAIDLMERNDIGWAWWPLKKIGDSSPLKVEMPQGFKEILDYWDGKSAKPTEEDAYDALMQLADNFKFENTSKQNHVIEALFQ